MATVRCGTAMGNTFEQATYEGVKLLSTFLSRVMVGQEIKREFAARD